MGLKILHTADWHLDAPFSSFPAEQRKALRSALLEIPALTVRICHEEACDLVLLAGDIFDGTPTRSTIDTLKDAFSQIEVPILIAPGNHDFCCPGSPWLEERWPENVHVFKDALSCTVIPSLDCRIYGAGYTSMDCPPLLKDFHAEGNERYCIALLHGDPTASDSPCCPISAADVRESGLDYLALGHIHKGGSFRAGNTLCAWPGCPMGRGWDETGEKDFLIVSLEDSCRIRRVPLPTIRFSDLTADIGNDPLAALEAILPAGESRNYFRVTLTGTAEAPLPQLLSAFPHLPHLTLRDRTRKPSELWADAGEDTLRGMYFHILQERLKTAPEQDTGRILLAARLARDLLDGKEVTLP